LQPAIDEKLMPFVERGKLRASMRRRRRNDTGDQQRAIESE
jgi:hypothetical protein